LTMMLRVATLCAEFVLTVNKKKMIRLSHPANVQALCSTFI